jgi:predicted O-methyltransferase YrrM
VLTKQDVLAAIRAELAGSRTRSAGAAFEARIGRVRELQRQFRQEPLGGRLMGLKKLFHWFSASAFDRQAKVVEALVDAVDQLGAERESLVQRLLATLDGAERPTAAVPAEPDSGTGESPTAELAARVAAAVGAEAEMLLPERLALFALVYGVKPRTVLEIGTFRGGSALIMVQAMDANGFGDLCCVDPQPRIPPAVWSAIVHRATLFEGASPGILGQVATAAPDGFDFALIDGDHSYEGALADAEATLPRMAKGGRIVFHDAHFDQVERAIDDFVARHPDISDAGLVSVEANPVPGEGVWGGLRLLVLPR